MTGIVKWFDASKGYGFIISDYDNSEIFVHYSGIVSEGYKNLDPGQKVEFDLYEVDGRTIALQVKKYEKV